MNFELSNLASLVQSLVLLVMPWSDFTVLLPKILSEVALCLAVFCLHCFIEDQDETCSGTLLLLDEDFVGLNFMKGLVSSMHALNIKDIT